MTLEAVKVRTSRLPAYIVDATYNLIFIVPFTNMNTEN